MKKYLNLYAGLGGNRNLLGEEWQVTAIEKNKEIAALYKKRYPNDIVIVTDAHTYLLEHINEYDFYWSSPPCPTNSKLQIPNAFSNRGKGIVTYPDMSLYQEIILLKYFTPKKSKWVVENVQPYYPFLIKPQIILGRHSIWSNFYIRKHSFKEEQSVEHIEGNAVRFGYSLQDEKITSVKKRILLRNLVNPSIGEYLVKESEKNIQPVFNFNY
jgi:DNA (cytosine-5)-methyltransferase 1